MRRQVFLRVKVFQKGTYCFSLNILSRAAKSCSTLEAKNLEKHVLRNFYSNISIVNIWNKSRGVHTQKAPRIAKLTFTLLQRSSNTEVVDEHWFYRILPASLFINSCAQSTAVAWSPSKATKLFDVWHPQRYICSS